MKLKEGFVLRDVCGEKIIVGEGQRTIDFGHLISLNDTAAWIWSEADRQGEFTVDSLCEALCEEYEVSPKTAHADVQGLMDQWMKLGIVEC